VQQLLIFDFDGVIIDSGRKIAELLNNMAPDFGLKRVPESELEKFRKFGSRELLKELKVPIYKLPAIMTRLRKELSDEIPNLKLVSGISEILKSLSDKGFRMGIISSNSEMNVKEFLKKNNIDFFDFIEGGNSVFGKHRKIIKIIKKENALKDKCIYIGDETRDIEAARKAGVKVAAVSWGLNSREALEKYQPDWLLENPKNLLLL